MVKGRHSTDSSQKEILADLAISIPVRSYLEIGVQEGQSLQAVVENSPLLSRLVLCDTWGRRCGGTNRGNHEHIEKLLKKLCYEGSVRFLDGDSMEMIPKLEELFDLVHVDGDHSYKYCLADLENGWTRCVRALVAHDASFEGVHKALFMFGGKHAKEIAEAMIAFGGHGTMVFGRSPLPW